MISGTRCSSKIERGSHTIERSGSKTPPPPRIQFPGNGNSAHAARSGGQSPWGECPLHSPAMRMPRDGGSVSPIREQCGSTGFSKTDRKRWRYLDSMRAVVGHAVKTVPFERDVFAAASSFKYAFQKASVPAFTASVMVPGIAPPKLTWFAPSI